MIECLCLLREWFSGWTVGYFQLLREEELVRCGVEVSRRIAPKRIERRSWAAPSWSEVLAQLDAPEAPND